MAEPVVRVEQEAAEVSGPRARWERQRALRPQRVPQARRVQQQALAEGRVAQMALSSERLARQPSSAAPGPREPLVAVLRPMLR